MSITSLWEGIVLCNCSFWIAKLTQILCFHTPKLDNWHNYSFNILTHHMTNFFFFRVETLRSNDPQLPRKWNKTGGGKLPSVNQTTLLYQQKKKYLVVVNRRAWMLNKLSAENNHSEWSKPDLSPFSFYFILLDRQDLYLRPILTG